MKSCGKGFVLISLLLCFSLSLVAGQSTPSTASDQAVLDPLFQAPSDLLTPQSSSSETPGQASDELLTYAVRLDQMSSELKTLFQAAGISLTDSEGSLFSSEDTVSKSIDSIRNCEASIQQAQKLARQRTLELWIWRGVAVVGAGIAVYEATRK
jgi:hypothetical protein